MKKSLLIGLLVILACQKEQPLDLTPVIQLSGTQFETTSEIPVTAILESANRLNEKDYLVRWDWDGDGVFDTKYSSNFTTIHRFLKAGNYTVVLEVLHPGGKKFQGNQSVAISQGYSKPKPAFQVSPQLGNTKTRYSFDASDTHDDEEEMEFLTFSWDFNNDRDYEEVRRGNPFSQHQFESSGEKTIRLVVTDSSGLSAELLKSILVTRLDTLIKPVVSYTPAYPTDWDTIRFDASKSYYQGDSNKALFVSYKEQNGSWKEAGDSAIFYWGRAPIGISSLQVRVYTEDQFYMEAFLNIQVTKGDRPPKAFFKRSSRFGNVQTRFFFDAWGSADEEDMPSALQVKWDFDGDGSWDSPYSFNKYAQWTYTIPGKYIVKMRVLDSAGGIGEYENDIHVSAFSNPTGYVYDQRSDGYYGTVKLGNRWWMGENLRYNPNRDTIPGTFLTWCYADNPAACAATGKLYLAQSILNAWNEDQAQKNICPEGWRLPTAEEWRSLVSLYGSDQAGTALYYGGESDFNALYGGYAGYYIYGGYTDFEMDSIYKTAVFMTSTMAGNQLRVFQLKRDSAHVAERKMILNGYYSIRCIRKE